MFFLNFEHFAHVTNIHLCSCFRSTIFVYDQNVLGFGELHNKCVESVCLDTDLLNVGCIFAKLLHKYLQVNLNCLMILAIFSYFKISFFFSL